MRKYLVCVLLLLGSCFAQSTLPSMGSTWSGAAGGGGTFTFTQNPINNSCAGSSCVLTVSAVGAGHLLYVQMHVNNPASAPSITSITGDSGTWVFPAGCQSFQGGGGSHFSGLACGYLLSAGGSETSITVNCNCATGNIASVTLREYSSTTGVTLDGTPSNSAPATCTSCVAPTAGTLTGTNDLIISAGYENNNSALTCSAPFTNATPTGGTPIFVSCDQLNVVSNTGATFTTSPTSLVSMSTIAFKD